MIASAVLDRLLHHSHVLNIRGESYPAQRETPGRAIPVSTTRQRSAGGGRRQPSQLTESLDNDTTKGLILSCYGHLLGI